MNWLAPDLTRRLNERLQRIMYLDAGGDAVKEAKPDLTSHIQVSGNYLIRAADSNTQPTSPAGADSAAGAPGDKGMPSVKEPTAATFAMAPPWIRLAERPDQRELIIQARIRIGPPGRPEVLARRVCYVFPSSLSSAASSKELELPDYGQIVERVYYNVASTIYEQICEDVQRKILLLPTRYLQAVALYHEAEDYAQSGTLQSYEAAGALYRQAAALVAPYDPFVAGHVRSKLLQVCYRAWGALRTVTSRILGWFDPWLVGSALLAFLLLRSWKAFPELWKALVWSKDWSSWTTGLVKVAVPLGKHNVSLLHVLAIGLATVAALEMLRLGLRKRDLLLARLETGCANMLLFRSRLSTLLAQHAVPIYEAKSFAERSWQITERLASARIKSTAESRELDGQLFNANATLALSFSLLGDLGTGLSYLKRAKARLPARTTADMVYLLAEAAISGPQEALDILNRAAETYPQSEIVTFWRASTQEDVWRTSAHPLSQHCDTERVIETYQAVLCSNPGNIGGLTNLGYVYWLTRRPDDARRYFQLALDYEEFMSDMVMSEIHYGLARLHAEAGNIDEAYRHLTLAETEARAYQATHYGSFKGYYFALISEDVFRRFREMRRNFCKNGRKGGRSHEAASRDGDKQNGWAYKAVRSFVFNDYGEASWAMYWRTGDLRYRRRALTAFDLSHASNPRNLTCLMNLANLRRDKKLLECARELEPNRLDVLLAIDEARSTEAHERAEAIKAKIIELQTRRPAALAGPSKSTGTSGAVPAPWPDTKPEAMASLPATISPKRARALRFFEAAISNFWGLRFHGPTIPDEKLKDVNTLREEVGALVRFVASGSYPERLLSHHWLRTSRGFNWDAFTNASLRNEGRWEREFNGQQVRALYAWAAPRIEPRKLLRRTISVSTQQTKVKVPFIAEADRKAYHRMLGGVSRTVRIENLQSLIEETFTPADLNILLREYEGPHSIELAKRMAGIVRYNLQSDPANYDQLRWLFKDFMRAGGCGTPDQLAILQRACEAGSSPWIRAWLALAYVRWGNELQTNRLLTEDLPEQLQALEPADAEDCYIRAMNEADQLAKFRPYGPDCREPFGEPRLWGMALLRLAAFRIRRGGFGEARNAVARAIRHLWYGDVEEFLEFVSQPEDRVLYRLCFEDAYRTGDFETSKARLTADVCKSLLRRALPAQPNASPQTPPRRMNVLVPIRLEIDDELLTDTVSNLLLDKGKGLIPQMRARIQAQFGVAVPGTRLSSSPVGTPADYRILLNEVTFATGSLAPPLNAAPNDVELRRCFAPVLQELEHVLIRNLVLWIEVQEVQNLLERHCYEAYSERIAEFETYNHILPLTALVQSLVEERTPITEFARIYNFYRQFPDRSEIDQMAAALRMLPFIREKLWGNDGSRSCVVLGAGTEDALTAKIIRSWQTEVLPLSGEERLRLLAAFRRSAETAAVVVRKPSLRKHVWRLVSEELPELPVLAECELVGALTGHEPRIEVAEWELKRKAFGDAS